MAADNPAVNGKALALPSGIWPRFLVALRSAGIPARTAQWYERWIERFASFVHDTSLISRRYADVRDFLATVSRWEGIEGWQVLQAEQALLILYRDVIEAPWIGDWQPLEPSAAPPGEPRLAGPRRGSRVLLRGSGRECALGGHG